MAGRFTNGMDLWGDDAAFYRITSISCLLLYVYSLIVEVVQLMYIVLHCVLLHGVARTLRTSADELKLHTDKISQEHYAAGREMADRAQAFNDFIDQQRKIRTKVID